MSLSISVLPAAVLSAIALSAAIPAAADDYRPNERKQVACVRSPIQTGDAKAVTPSDKPCLAWSGKETDPKNYRHFRYFDIPQGFANVEVLQALDGASFGLRDVRSTMAAFPKAAQEGRDWGEQRTLTIGGFSYSLQRFALPTMPCIAMTSYRDPPPVGPYFTQRVAGYLCKPQGVDFADAEAFLARLRIDTAVAMETPVGADATRTPASPSPTAVPGNPPPAPRPPGSGGGGRSTGSGFLLNGNGDVLTNNHVVRGCATLNASHGGRPVKASVVALREADDLAVIRVPGLSAMPLPFRGGKDIRPAEAVVAVGFPFAGMLTTTPQVTTGSVTALAGLRDDARYMQISAPIQPGNSGGPLLDSSGNAIGIVSATLNAMAVAKVTGSVPQNVNFAIKQSVARDFLTANNIPFQTAPSTRHLEPADVGEIGTRSVVFIECLK